MSLDRVAEIRLTGASLTNLYKKELVVWRAMAKRAYDYEKEAIAGSGANAQVRQEDVIPALRMQLEVAPKLRDYLAKPSRPQKFWYYDFAALIVDRLWAELTKSQTQEGTAGEH